VVLGLIGFSAAIAPVLWVVPPSNSSGAGRFLYLAGAWLCLPLGCGLSRLDSDAAVGRSTLRRTLFGATFTLLALCSLWSLRYQAAIWRAATSLARESIAQMKPHASGHQKLFVTNLPGQFVEGPYVLKEYAFAYYFQNPGLQVPARPMALEYTARGVRFAGWLKGSDRSPDAAETKIDLRLDVPSVEPMPRGGIDAPRAHSVVRQPFDLTGWAIDTSAAVGTGVDTVHVQAYPDPGSGRPPTWIDVASYGESRRNVSDKFGSQFSNSGWTVRVSGLASGTYMLAAFPHDRLASAFTPPFTRVVIIK
jgi:hypothetical protein